MTANGLSVARILLAPVLLFLLHHDAGTTSAATLLLLVVAALSDLLDGYVARRYGQVSQLGRILDPIADKLFLGTLGVGLFLWRGFPAWLLVAILVRDTGIVLVGSFLLRRYNVVIPPNYFGKYATVSLALVALAHLIEPAAAVREELAFVAGAMLLVSSVSYARELRRKLVELHQRSAVPPDSQRCRSA